MKEKNAILEEGNSQKAYTILRRAIQAELDLTRAIFVDFLPTMEAIFGLSAERIAVKKVMKP